MVHSLVSETRLGQVCSQPDQHMSLNSSKRDAIPWSCNKIAMQIVPEWFAYPLFSRQNSPENLHWKLNHKLHDYYCLYALQSSWSATQKCDTEMTWLSLLCHTMNLSWNWIQKFNTKMNYMTITVFTVYLTMIEIHRTFFLNDGYICLHINTND